MKKKFLPRSLRLHAPGTPVLISADETVAIGRGLALLGEMREAGITEVAFQTKPQTEK